MLNFIIINNKKVKIMKILKIELSGVWLILIVGILQKNVYKIHDIFKIGIVFIKFSS